MAELSGRSVSLAWASPSQSAHSVGPARLVEPLCVALLAGTVLFNAGLALVNAHVRPVGGSTVAGVQALIELGAIAIGVVGAERTPWRWIVTCWAIVMTLLTIAAVRAQLDAKAIGDALLIPAFIMLGTRISAPALTRTLVWLQALLLAVGIWELLSPGGFGALFKVVSYYVNSRGFDAARFWAGGDLFLSSERPHGRLLLPSSGLHRGSSLFLEPVSLGNWAIVSAIATATLWRYLTWLQRGFMALSVLMLLVVCDGRLALSVTLLLVLYLPIARYVPGRVAALYMPAIVVALLAARGLGYLTTTADNFPGRLRYGIAGLQKLDLMHMLAVADPFPGIDDAGWADFIQTESIFVALGLWLVVTLTDIGSDGESRMCKHGIALFLTMCLPISNSILSIKTAAMMWACYGFCYARAQRNARRADSAAAVPAAAVIHRPATASL